MGVFDKIKNALFEEEYVEVEEKPKTKQKKEKSKKEVKKEPKEVVKVKENKPIAKKVILPEKKEERVVESYEEELLEEDFEIAPTKKEETAEFKFPAVADTDFAEEEDFSHPEPEIVKVVEREVPKAIHKEVKPTLYGGKKDSSYYGFHDDAKTAVSEYGAYEKKEDKTYFKPSPIISPIYGILDKNYKKEEIVAKREVRLTSSYAREHLSVDDVRKKAFGSLADDIAATSTTPTYSQAAEEENFSSKEEEESNLLVDLSADDEKPKVHEVTMGDAEEYFQDLGLEYNIDYKDASKDRVTGRRVSEDYKEEEIVKRETEPIHKPIEKRESSIDIDSDDNLFDLIDSMYEDEK